MLGARDVALNGICEVALVILGAREEALWAEREATVIGFCGCMTLLPLSNI